MTVAFTEDCSVVERSHLVVLARADENSSVFERPEFVVHQSYAENCFRLHPDFANCIDQWVSFKH